MVPVGPLVAPVDQVAGQENELDAGMPAKGRRQPPAPSFQPCLGIAHVEKLDSAGVRTTRLGGSPGPPPSR